MQGESVNELLDQLDSTITVVIADRDERWYEIVIRAKEDTCVIAVLPDLEIGDFIRAIRSGANGAVWEDTPTTHLANVAHAALRNDVLLPQPVLTAIVTGQSGTTPNEVDTADIEILRHFSEGKTLAGVAEATFIHKRTVQRRITSICLTLGAANPTHAVHIATKHGYL